MDVESSTLQGTKAKHVTFQRGDGTLHAHAWVVGSIWCKTHVALPRHTANSEHTIGAMEEASGKVQNASTHALRCQRHEHAHTAVGQFKG